jgi:dienelactone hydrolase
VSVSLGSTKKLALLLLLNVLMMLSHALAQSEPEQVGSLLGAEISPANVAVFELKQYILSRVAEPPVATRAAEWSAQAERTRQHLLNDVVFHGWPKEWVNSPAKFEDLGVIETNPGYRLRKLRYEIVPGFYSAAILYEPSQLSGKVPAVLNVNGHVGPPGKAIEYKQKICINFAKRGILALNLEWFEYGELAHRENAHWFGAHLDLVGANGLGLFYLAIRRGLDYLYDHPNVDRSRLGMTGLSGGGWQTLVLSSLDKRVTVSVPVAGFGPLATKLVTRPRYGDLGDFEQNGTDLLDGQDYTHLAAMMAPRPTMLIFDAEDDCCFRAPLVKPLIFYGSRPFFRLYGKEANLGWYENRDPGTHNYLLNNRLQSYRFFSEHFGLPVIDNEIPAGLEIKSADELVVGLPKQNLTILGLARQMAARINREAIPSEAGAKTEWASAQRQKLNFVIRYHPLSVGRAWTVFNTKNQGVETKSYLFQMKGRAAGEPKRVNGQTAVETINGLVADGVWLKAIEAADGSPLTIVLNDKGKKTAAMEVSDRINRGDQVLALDLLFTGDAWKDREDPHSYAQILDALGDRTTGLEAAQLVALAHWACATFSTGPKVRLEATGIRNQVTALIAAALEPGLFSEVLVHEGMPSLGYLLDAPVTFQEAPDLFCLDLYKDFDLDSLAAMAAPARVKVEKYIPSKPKTP